MFFNKILTLFLSVFMALISGQSFASTHKDQSEKKPQVGVFIFKLDDVYINSVANFIEKSLATKTELTIFDANNNQTTQSNQLAAYLEKNIDAVAINLVDIKAGQNIINMVRKKNIPLIFFNKEPDLRFLKNYEKSRYVGTKASEAGVMQGEIIADLWKNNPQFDRNQDGINHFIMIQGGLDNPEALLRSRVSVQRARALGVKMQQIGDTLICDWDANCAYNAAKLALAIDGNRLDFVISNNDDMAIGAIKALQETGFNTKGNTYIPVVGVDAIKKAKQYIAEGSMHGTVLQDAKAMGETVATMLLNAIEKKPFLHNLSYKYDESGICIRIPYKAFKK